jgi:DNA-binding transcriptional LysR family regulator
MRAELIRSGAGGGVLPCFLGDADPGLVRMGPPIEEVGYEAWLMMHDDERHRPEMRTAIERLAALFARERRRLAGDMQEQRAGAGE